MRNPLTFLVTALVAAIAYSSPASATCPVPNTLTNGQVADATQVMDNFNALGNCTVSIAGSSPTGSLSVISGPKTISTGNLTGDVTTSGSTTTTLAPSGVTPGSYTKANITVDAKGRVTAAANGSGGTGGADWTLVDQTGAPTAGPTWTWSANVTNVDVTGLGSYNELLVVVRGTTTSTSGTRRILVSVDGGSTFYSAAADYIFITTGGVETGNTGFNYSGSTTAARSFSLHLKNLKGPIKVGTLPASGGSEFLFVGSTSDINAIRLDQAAGGSLTAGTLYVYAR